MLASATRTAEASPISTAGKVCSFILLFDFLRTQIQEKCETQEKFAEALNAAIGCDAACPYGLR